MLNKLKIDSCNIVLENGEHINLKYYLTHKQKDEERLSFGICIEKYLLSGEAPILLEEKSILCEGYTEDKVISIINLIVKATVTPISLEEILLDLRHDDFIHANKDHIICCTSN